MDEVRKFLSNEKVKGGIAITAAVIMYFTPDHIDLLIETLLGAFGISKFVIDKKD